MPWLDNAATALVAFLLGLVAPTLRTAIDALVKEKITDRTRIRGQADIRSRAAAEVCYEELSKLVESIPQLHARERLADRPEATDADRDARNKVKNVHDGSIASLEANLVLLRTDVREEMARILDVLRFAYDLPYRSRPMNQLDEGWHPDRATNIANALVKHARNVLAAHLTTAKIPDRSDAVEEYILANDERSADIEEYFSHEIEEDDEQLKSWRVKRGLPPDRKR